MTRWLEKLGKGKFSTTPQPEPLELSHRSMKGCPMITVNHLNSKHVAVIFTKQGDSDPTYIQRRIAQTLLWLIHKGEQGVTAQEVSSWALRLSSYIHILRHKHSLNIITLKESHDGGQHARYVLRDVVELLDIIPEPDKT